MSYDENYGLGDIELPPRGMNPPLPLSDAEISILSETKILPEDLALIKLTAQFVARYGRIFWSDLVCRVLDVYPQFNFFYKTDHRFRLYTSLVRLYQRVFTPFPEYKSPLEITALKGFFLLANLEVDEAVYPYDDDEPSVIGVLASADGLDCFTYIEDPDYSAFIPYPQPLSVMMKLLDDRLPPPLPAAQQPDLCPPSGRSIYRLITQEELAIVKFTALFVARFGRHFHSALMMSVVTNPRFQFLFFDHQPWPPYHSMDTHELMHYVFSALVDSYSKVLLPSQKLKKKNPACAQQLLDFFFHRLQCKKLEEGDHTAIADLLAFVSGPDTFARCDDPRYPIRTDVTIRPVLLDPPQPLSVMCNLPTHMHPRILVLLPHTNPHPPPDYVSPLDRPYISPYNIATTFPSTITLKELAVIRLTAQFMCRYGSFFRHTLENKVALDPLFQFLKENGRRSDFYNGLLTVYGRVYKFSKKVEKCPNGDFAFVLDDFFSCLQLEKEDEAAMIELHAFMSGADFFAHMDDPDYSAIMPPPQLFSEMTMNRLTQMHPDMLVQLPHRAQNQDNIKQVPRECVSDEQPSLDPTLRPLCSAPFICHDWDATPEELSIIKLTALFVARYGMLFCRDLVKKVGVVGMEHQFKFMEPTDQMFRIYNIIVVAYSKVLHDSRRYRDTILERYFECLQWKNGPMIDWHAFAEGVDYFARMEDDNYSDLLLNMRRCKVHHMRYHDDQFESQSTGMIRPHVPLTLPEEPEPKRQKIEESGLVPEDQFLAQYPGSSTIKVVIRHWSHYQCLGPQKTIEMTVKSLAENVASLKEKIAGEIKIPAKKLKLIGKAGYLKNDKSLAHYNVGVGEMLAVNWRSSRWS